MEDHKPQEEQLRQLQGRMESLEKLVQGLVRRVYLLEGQKREWQKPSAAKGVSTEETLQELTASAEPASCEPSSVSLPLLPEQPPFREVLAETGASKSPGVESLESKIGGNWLNKIGMVSLVLGMVYFLKYAIDNQWIGETGRVALGILTGLGLLSGGGALQKRH